MIKKKANPFNLSCPSRDVLDVIGDKWAILLLCVLHEGKFRTGELRRAIDGISQKMLIQSLRKLEENGIVKRTSHPEVPPRVEYELTKLGYSLCTIVLGLENWVVSNYPEIVKARKEFSQHDH